MSFEVSLFKRLRETYTSWDALKTHLTSEEGGNFTIRDCENTPFAIIRYKKGETVLGEEGHWLRSVVWNKETHMPVCVSPRKANDGPPPVGTSLHLDEFYDGVMINVFRVLGSDEEHVVTRSSYGATGTFYSNKTFKQLYDEAVAIAASAAANVRKDVIDMNDYMNALNAIPQLPTAEFPATFTSYVLQHPEHRVVFVTSSPRLVKVEHGKIAADGTVLYSEWTHGSTPKTFTEEKEIHELMRAESINRGWRWQGLIFRDTAGNRWRIRSSTYTYLRKMRGNEAKPLERFLRLRSTKELTEYLKHYGEERQIFWEFETLLRKRTKEIYDSYVAVHKSHEKKLADLQQPDKTVVFKLHSHYLSVLRSQSKTIKMQDVIDLVNSFPLWEQALLLKKGLQPMIQMPMVHQDESLLMQPPQMAPELLAN